ncbi:hypothetical protein [Glycomyces sp. NPDC047010]|uniref:hypothetical protein n=1 Tax=Glycomyces sp. NPDC047010 TaxID=3155023 RepID=UPI0033E95A63
MASINGIYLPGWEYNRLLADDPLEPRNSALPGAVFWNGSAPLWMFEKIFCTRESLENESFAAQEIGWATSRIFVQMAAGVKGEGPMLEAVDWKETDIGTSAALRQVHRDLTDLGARQLVSRWIEEADDAQLEHVKHALIRPVADAKQCVIAGSMSGLRHWLSPASGSDTPSGSEIADPARDLLVRIERPIRNSRVHNGVQLLSPPSSWDATAVAQQNRVKREVETPYIQEMLAGTGQFSGPRGFAPYIRNAARERAAYQAIDLPLLADWQRNLPTLLRLREVASKHLWPKLHGDWIPALMRGDHEALRDYPRYINSALMARHFAGLLNLSTNQVLSIITAGISVIAAHNPSLSEAATYLAAGATLLAIPKRSDTTPRSAALAIFYQEAARVLKNGSRA